MLRHDVQETQRLSPQDISKWNCIWQPVKDDYKEGIFIYRTLPNLHEPGVTLETMSQTRAMVDLLVPHLFQPNLPTYDQPAFKVTIMQIEGILSMELLEEALTSQLHKYLDRALGRLVIVDAHPKESLSLRIHPVNMP